MRPEFRLFWLIVVIFINLIDFNFLASVQAGEELRNWADAKGKSKIKAKFVKLEDDVVTLEKEDGDEVEIELKKLSDADQKYAIQASKDADDNPFKSKSDDPFKAKSKSKKMPGNAKGKSKDKDMDSSDSSDDVRKIKVDLISTEQISLASPSDEWKVEIPAADGRPGTGKPKPIAIPPKTEFFDGLKGVAFNCGSSPKNAVVGFELEKPANPNTVTRVALCDLATGKCGTPAASPGRMVPIALHDDGHQILMRRDEFGFGNLDRLEVWTPKGNKVNKSIAWCPYDSSQGADRDVMWAEFLGPEMLATASRDGKVVLWKFPDIEPVCKFEVAKDCIPAVSPNRKLIAYSTGPDVGLIDVEKREVIAQQSAPSTLRAPRMAFSPTASRLGCLSMDTIFVWNTATGELERSLQSPGMPFGDQFDFPDDNFVLAGKRFLIELENQVKLWTFDGAENVRSINGVTYFAVTNGDKAAGAIIPISLPHPAAKDLLKKALTEPNLFVVSPGTNVKIDVNGIQDASQRERVSAGLRKQLEAIECKGGNTGTVDLVASVEGPKERTLKFRHAGEFKVKEFIVRVKFVYQNQAIWESSQSNVEHFVMLKAGENIETHLRANEKPHYEFFERVTLPKLVQKPMAAKGPNSLLTLGSSHVSTGGLK